MSLIKEINDLRRELKIARTQVHDLEAALGINKKNKNQQLEQQQAESAFSMNGTNLSSREGKHDENVRIIDMQRSEIRKLRTQLMEAEQMVAQRPPSGGRLPPVLAQ